MLQVDLVDVYMWLNKEGYSRGIEVAGMAFSVEEDALVLSRTGGADPVYVDTAEPWKWIIDEQLPKGVSGYETVFGVPQVLGDGDCMLQITFAASNESDPRTWAKPPACLGEWKQAPPVDSGRLLGLVK